MIFHVFKFDELFLHRLFKTVAALLLALLFCQLVKAQGVLPIHRYFPQNVFPGLPVSPSFSYSLRQIRPSYKGMALRVRRASTFTGSNDNAEADVAFDDTGIVSGASSVTITAAGASGLAVGTTMTLSTFKGTRRLFVKTWYDQGFLSTNAIQNTASGNNQPELQFNIAGTANTLPSLVFTGTQNLEVQQALTSILGNGGITGTFILWTKPLSNSNHECFGTWSSSTAWRWSFHLNWSDGNCYFDSAELCCAPNRAFANSANVNLYKQYTFIRGLTFKTVRINGVATTLNNSSAASTTPDANVGKFSIGTATFGSDPGYQGNLSEILMVPKDLTVVEVASMESNMLSFWQ